MNHYGCVFFNYGHRCIIRLLTSLYSLRQYYDGPITVLLNINDKHNQDLIDDMGSFNVTIRFFSFANALERWRCIIKPYIISQSPYTYTLLVESDILFIKHIDEIWPHIKNHDLVLTKLRIKKKRANIGIMGINNPTDSNPLITQWRELVELMFYNKNPQAIDEKAINIISKQYKTKLLDRSWNLASKYPLDRETRAIHFIGDKHRRYEHPHGKLWYDYFIRMATNMDISRWYWTDDKIIIKKHIPVLK